MPTDNIIWWGTLQSKWNQYRQTMVEDYRLSFRSKASGYTIGILVALIFSAINGIIFGVGWDDQFDLGTWLVLGGFTIWVPTSGLILPAIIGLSIQNLAIQRRITIEGDNKKIRFSERIFLITRKPYEINRDDIRMIRITRDRLGLKSIWFILFGAHLVYMMTNGLSLLLNPTTFGYGIGNALMFTIAGCIDLMFIILISFSPQTVIQIHTDKEIFRFSYYHKDRREQIYKGLEKIVGMPISAPQSRGNKLGKIIFLQSGWVETMLGTGLIFWATMSYIYKIFAGSPLRYPLILLGLLLIVTGVKQTNFNKTPGRSIYMEDCYPRSLFFKNDLTLHKETVYLQNFESQELKVIQRPLWLSPLMTALIWIISALMGWTMAVWFKFLPYSNLPNSLIGKTILNVGLTSITMATLITLSLRICSHLQIDGKTGKILISPFPLVIGNSEEIIEYKSHKSKIRYINSGFIAIFFVMGVVLALTI